MRTSTLLVILIIILSIVSCNHYDEQEIPVIIDIGYSVIDSDYSVPVTIQLSNNTAGADFYKWTFEGATPSSSADKIPGEISYTTAGTYRITLEAWNDTQRSTRDLIVQLDSAVNVDFDVAIAVNAFAPATVNITNKTRGASTYVWTFDGASPSISQHETPPPVVYSTPGDHVITLKVSNGRELYTLSKTITVLDALAPDFDIEPSHEDYDFEAPFTASLVNKTVSGIHYKWESSGGVIDNRNAENAQITFNDSGEYTITLTADNDKETKTYTQTVTIKPNTNLYIMKDVKLGVSSAHKTIGCFYSTKLRRVLREAEVTEENGSLIDIVFYGINSSFSYCRFVSPDKASDFTFPSIPGAIQNYNVNTLEATTLTLTAAQFDAMTNDEVLANLDVSANDTDIAFFTKEQAPRIVLFETSDRRIGAIKVKGFVAEGTQSYILADIKVQKAGQ
ncbi:PKD domain-containing protein [Chryseosolibacter indicus]|uniref:PKD domain-containing protein n=1 Tax=Chryseosolibacter indicus TaxID=2782351 RepID=A0ABS5VY12_9BACT|nr:PKD domain-containing protein [Chryseosolibacter indicus]MBT1705953.1 PKD domain-containing protein [Chryseosolibacter indicus]